MVETYLQTYFVRVRTRRYNNTVYEMDNLTKDEALDKVRFYTSPPYSSHYHVELWDNLTEERISPRQFVEDNL